VGKRNAQISFGREGIKPFFFFPLWDARETLFHRCWCTFSGGGLLFVVFGPAACLRFFPLKFEKKKQLSQRGGGRAGAHFCELFPGLGVGQAIPVGFPGAGIFWLGHGPGFLLGMEDHFSMSVVYCGVCFGR